MIIDRRVAHVDEGQQAETGRGLPFGDEGTFIAVIAGGVEAVFQLQPGAEPDAERGAGRQRGIEFRGGRVPRVVADQNAGGRLLARPAQAQIDNPGGGGKRAAQCRRAYLDGGGAHQPAGWGDDGIEVEAIDADIAGHHRRETAHAFAAVEAGDLAADRSAEGIAGLTHGVFRRSAASGGDRRCDGIRLVGHRQFGGRRRAVVWLWRRDRLQDWLRRQYRRGEQPSADHGQRAAR